MEKPQVSLDSINKILDALGTLALYVFIGIIILAFFIVLLSINRHIRDLKNYLIMKDKRDRTTAYLCSNDHVEETATPKIMVEFPEVVEDDEEVAYTTSRKYNKRKKSWFTKFCDGVSSFWEQAKKEKIS